LLKSNRKELSDFREREAAPPAWTPLALLLAISLGAVAVLESLGGYWPRAASYDDTVHYASAVAVIRTGDVQRLPRAKLFWGLPYASAAVSALTPLSDVGAVVAVSALSSVGAVALLSRLWGPLVAAWFALLSTDWIQRTILGGGEPLFLLLVLAAFSLARAGRWNLASLAAAAGATVRPHGLFALLGLGAAAILRKDYRRLIPMTAVAAAVFLLYAAPLARWYSDPLANVRGYQEDWSSAFPVTWPFLPLWRGWRASVEPLSNTLKILFWLALVLTGLLAALRSPDFRRHCAAYPAEAVFAGLYLLFLFTYDSAPWSWSQFPRFTIPVLPLLLLALEPHLPRRRTVTWTAAGVSSLLAAASAIGVHNFWTLLRHGH
jgi:hypothetical protein